MQHKKTTSKRRKTKRNHKKTKKQRRNNPKANIKNKQGRRATQRKTGRAKKYAEESSVLRKGLTAMQNWVCEMHSDGRMKKKNAMNELDGSATSKQGRKCCRWNEAREKSAGRVKEKKIAV